MQGSGEGRAAAPAHGGRAWVRHQEACRRPSSDHVHRVAEALAAALLTQGSPVGVRHDREDELEEHHEEHEGPRAVDDRAARGEHDLRRRQPLELVEAAAEGRVEIPAVRPSRGAANQKPRRHSEGRVERPAAPHARAAQLCSGGVQRRGRRTSAVAAVAAVEGVKKPVAAVVAVVAAAAHQQKDSSTLKASTARCVSTIG